MINVPSIVARDRIRVPRRADERRRNRRDVFEMALPGRHLAVRTPPAPFALERGPTS